MVKLRNILDKISAMRFIFDDLELCSGIARKNLLSQDFMYDTESITKEIKNVSGFYEIVKSSKYASEIEKIQIKLKHILDISGTLKNLSENLILDDIQLFEIKKLALTSDSIRILIDEIGFNKVNIPDLESVIKILDPDNQRIPHFYIYPSYNSELSELRKTLDSIDDDTSEEYMDIQNRCTDLEDKVRAEIAKQLLPYSSDLKTALQNIAYIDIILAKALQAVRFGFCKPVITEQETQYKSLFNPLIKHNLESQNKKYQNIDITLHSAPCLITGANMSGKTVVLKTVALAQFMLQFGFFIPATEAKINPVEEILLSIGDDQSEINGLSSFAAEMLEVNSIIKSAKSGRNILALIDELARTTNPEEGLALVNATIDILSDTNTRSLITTHYNNAGNSCRKLKVKGLITEKITTGITIKNINDYMDYSLIENDDNNVPMEAIRIASVLGVDKTLLEKADEYVRS